MRDKNGLSEREFLEIYKTKNYPRPYVTADIVIFAKKDGEIYVLLIRRKGHPYIGKWALPGGFLNQDETAEEGAARELFEETGVRDADIRLAGVFSRPGRDPRGWVVTIAYTACVDPDRTQVTAGDDAGDARWFKVGDADDLAFDHAEIIRAALEKSGLTAE